MIKVVVLGGSGVATPELARVLAHSSERTQQLALVLVGRNAEKLAKVAAVARLLAGNDPLLQIEHNTRLEEALEGADYVINQIRVGGLEARAFDETFPHELGLPGEETVGPGGFANASRTIPVVLEYARQMERLCPQATMLSFANPSSMVQYAVTHYTNVHTIGLCDGPVTLTANIAAALGVPAAELSLDYVGMHHFGWVTHVYHAGRDLTAQALEKADAIAKEVAPEIVRAIGALPGAYLNYVFHPDRMLAKKRGQPPRAAELLALQDQILDDFDHALASGQPPAALAQRKARWYQAIIAPVLLALVERASGVRFILNLVNGSTVPWLPAEAVVEVPALVDGGRVRPLATGLVPPEVQALLQANCTYEMLAVEAIVERDRAKALRALLINPIVQTYDQAAAVLEKAWGAEQA